MEITVKKMYLKRSPRKVRPVLFNLRRKQADSALAILKFGEQAVSRELYTLLKSGVAAFKDQDLDTDKVYIKNIKCDDGPRLKRRRIVSKGRATGIQKRMCHLTITLSDTAVEMPEDKTSKKAEAKKVENKEVKIEKKPENITKEETSKPKAKKKTPAKKTGSKE